MQDDFFYQSANAMLALLRNRKISVTELVQAHIARIERYNPRINALVTPTFEQALQQAKSADALLAKGEAKGALFGLPIAHKDSFPTKGVRTTFGSQAFADHVPAQDCVVVDRQQRAGAISLGKTNLPELAAGSHTFNELFGATHNPYAHGFSAGGSSGGAAAALAAGLVPLADGSDMGGSLRNPASFCNVVGLRPSVGRVANGPSALPFSHLAVSGPMGRSVADVALLLDVLAVEDPRDPLACAAPQGGYAKVAELDPKGLRIAVSASIGGLPFEPEVQRGFAEAQAHLQAMGCVLAEDEPDFSDADFAFETLRAVAFSASYRALRQAKGAMLKDTVRWNIDIAEQINAAQVADAARCQGVLFNRMRELLQTHDFLVAPVTQVLPFPVEQAFPQQVAGQTMPSYLGWMRSCSRITVTAHPSISVPCDFSADGRPIGLQIVGRYRDEGRLLAFAQQFEAAAQAQVRRPVLGR